MGLKDYEIARGRMVKEQLIGRGITDERVLRAMSIVPRHLFIDQGFWPRAYGDSPLPIDNDQTISQPYIVALMCQLLELPDEGAQVLEIGTGSGYQTAVLSLMGVTVFSIERHKELSTKAQKLLGRMGIDSVSYRVGDGTLGWPDKAPFHGIVVTAGAPVVPDDLIEQLAVGGKLVIPVGSRDGQRMMVIDRGEKFIEKRDMGDCSFVPLIGKKGWRND